MSEPIPVSAPDAPPRINLTPGQRRVLGVLIEKAKTTPAGYPMTVNAIVTGCNQISNRDPHMNLTPDDVEEIIEELRVLGLTVEAAESTRSTKFRHRAYEWFRVERAELAVLTELLLRGAQTLGDLRARAARFEPIADMAALKPIVDRLVQRGMMIELTPPGRGQLVTHNLYSPAELAELKSRTHGTGTHGDGAPGAHAEASGTPVAFSVATLAADVAALRTEVESLRERIAALESGGTRESTSEGGHS